MSSSAPLQERPRQEPSDLQPRTVLLIIAGIVAMVLLTALIAHLVLRLSGPTRNSPESLQAARSTRLASDPGEEIGAFERAKEARLHSYGWDDPQHQVAHIPIEVAMRRLADHGSASKGQQ